MKQLVFFIDVDDCLVRSFGSKRIPMTSMIEKVKDLKAQGVILYCWSSGGADYAKNTCKELKIENCFDNFLAKPDALIDDKLELKVIHPNEAQSLNSDEIVTKSRKMN